MIGPMPYLPNLLSPSRICRRCQARGVKFAAYVCRLCGQHCCEHLCKNKTSDMKALCGRH